MAALVMCVLAGSAQAAGSWRIEHAPSPYAAQGWLPELYGASCWDDQDCMAVGGTNVTGAWEVYGLSLAEERTPSGWRQLQVPTANEDGTELTSVSCPAAGECMAVGAVDLNSWASPLLEQFTAGAWHRLPAPPAVGRAILYGVSCPSTTWCMAAGIAPGATNRALIFDGTGWSESPPLPAGLIPDGVSCSSPTACEAAGWQYAPGGLGVIPSAAHWDGSAWHAQTTPPLPYGSSGFESVSCPTATFCTAVGGKENADYWNYGVEHTLVETWDGSRWTVANAPMRDGDFLWGVSCAAASSCEMVGETWSGGLTAGWDGAVWGVQPNPGRDDASELFGVSCPSVTSCAAVGTGPPEGVFVERESPTGGLSGAPAAAASIDHSGHRWSRARAARPSRWWGAARARRRG